MEILGEVDATLVEKGVGLDFKSCSIGIEDVIFLFVKIKIRCIGGVLICSKSSQYVGAVRL